IPRELVESALFGHERGAFTGAHRQQLGKFELASNGTLFLDEIGDLRLDLQAKLLRAIQEGEIERVGGSKPIKTEFRLITATNIDLEKAVKEGRFREDLFYRINVIPIKMPPLRERAEDIPQLVEFFLKRYTGRFRKKINSISDPTLAMLKKYWWPGNIRELENLIERLVAVSDKEYISEEDLPLEFHFAQLEPRERGDNSLFEEATNTFERNFLLRALEKCGWNVRVPLPDRNEVFLMNTLTDAQLLVSPDVTDLLDRYAGGGQREAVSDGERETLALLEENGFLVPNREADRRALDQYFASVKSDTAELSVTLLTTLQCNFACD